MDDWFVWIGAALAAVATLVTVFLMLADTTATAATGVSMTGGVDDCGGATTGAAAAVPAQPPKSGKSKSLMKAPVVEDAAAQFEAKQQALEVLQRSQLPASLQDQCGFEPDNYEGGGPWALAEPKPRIKESKVEAPLKAKLLGHVAKCFEEETIMGIRIPFEPGDVMEVLRTVQEYLKSEPMLIEDVPFGITVVGDLHGQLYDLHRIFLHDEKDGKPAWECMKYIFLGNYVDRGRQGLEILIVLFSLKALYPDRIFLLRGKHEFIKINIENGGFIRELIDRYDPDTAEDLFMNINGIFNNLSIAAIVQDKFLCLHSGISPHDFTRSNLRSLNKPLLKYEDDIIVTDMLWAEPAEGLRGTVFNGRRGSSSHFGLDALVHSLYTMGAEILVRAHSGLSAGYAFMGSALCISLTSATGTLGGDNDGSVMYINDEGYFKVMLLKMSKARVSWDRKLKLIDEGCAVKEVQKPPTKMVDSVGPPKNQKSIKRNKSIKKKKK